MIGVYDFCAHYEWTFAWLEKIGGPDFLKKYWDEAIHQDSQAHAAALIGQKGFVGMQEYWGHTLVEEAAGYSITVTDSSLRIDMHECPSQGFLRRNQLHQHRDYCDHCMGWIGPMMKAAGFVVDHQHNHRGQCWWEFRKAGEARPDSAGAKLTCEHDITRDSAWNIPEAELDSFLDANSVDDKLPKKA